jgi:hypothetical protein
MAFLPDTAATFSMAILPCSIARRLLANGGLRIAMTAHKDFTEKLPFRYPEGSQPRDLVSEGF